MIRDAHDNDLTDERLAFTSAVAQLALEDDLLNWAIVRSYKPSDLRTDAIIRRRPGVTMRVKDWPRSIFRSDTGIERAIRLALNPQTEIEDDQRTRIFMSSIHNDPLFINHGDAELLVELACRGSQR